MTKLQLLMVVLPVIFMLHDFEEIIMLRSWLDRNRHELHRRFPRFEAFLSKRGHFEYSTSAFAIGVAHEFILLSAVSLCSIYHEAYEWWFGVFMAYFIHLFVHIAQWIIYRKYVPVIITSLLTLPYCFYTFILFVKSSVLSFSQTLLWMLIGIVFIIFSLPSAFFFMSKFNKWEKRHEVCN